MLCNMLTNSAADLMMDLALSVQMAGTVKTHFVSSSGYLTLLSFRWPIACCFKKSIVLPKTLTAERNVPFAPSITFSCVLSPCNSYNMITKK